MGGQVLQTLRVQPPQSPADFAAYVVDPARQPEELLTLQAVAARQEGLEYLALALGELLTGQAGQVSPDELRRAFEQMAEHGLPKLHQALSRFGDSGEVRGAVAQALAQRQSPTTVRVVGAADIVVRDATTPPPPASPVGDVQVFEFKDWETLEQARQLRTILASENLEAVEGEAGSALRAFSKVSSYGPRSFRTHVPQIFGLYGSDDQLAKLARDIFSEYIREPLWRRALALDYYFFLFQSEPRKNLGRPEADAGCTFLSNILNHPQERAELRQMALVAYYRVVLHQLEGVRLDQLEEAIDWAKNRVKELKEIVGHQNQYVQWLEGSIRNKEEVLQEHSAVAREKVILQGISADLRSLGDLGAFLIALEKIAGILEDANADLELKKMAYALLLKINRPPIDVTLTDFSLAGFFRTALGRETVPVWMIHGRSVPANELLANRDRIRVLAPKILGFLRQGAPGESEGPSWRGRLRRILRH